MKNLLGLLVALCFTSMSFAQEFKIDEAARALNNGTFSSFLFELPDVSKKEAEDDWKAFMNDFKAKTKYDRKGENWISTDVKMPKLHDNPITVYAKIIEYSNPQRKTSVIVWFAAPGSYIARVDQAEKADYVTEVLTEYAMMTSKHHALNIVKEEEKSLKELESALKKLVKDNTEYHKEIEKAKELIAKRGKDIEINEADQKAKEKEIEDQQRKVSDAKENVKQFN